MSYSPGFDWKQLPAKFVAGGTRWTDRDGTGSGQSTTFLGGSGGVVSWSVAGAGWSDPAVFRSFSGTSVDMSTFLPFDFRATLRRAFDAWAAVANIEFIQVQDQGGNLGSAAFPTIRIFGGYIDGQSGSTTLAQAYFPSAWAAGGDIVFDSSDTNFFAKENNFYLTALHEIGHALGLDHETAKRAIMNPSINTSLKGLQADDIAGMRTVYGNQDFGPNHYFMAESQANMVILDSAPNLTVFGNDLDNMITGTAAGETIEGRHGNDTIVGGGGADTMRGGVGNDIYVVLSSDAVVVELAGAGSDTIKTSVNYVLKAGVAVEQIRATSSAGTAAIYFVGNELKQTIIGNAGDNILNDGGGAADTLRGLAGNDDYVVQNSGSVILELAGAGTDTIWTSVDYLLKTGVSVERMRTTSDAGTTAINLTGNELQQVITGNAGANVLNDGGGDADLLIGLGGDDTYWINNSGAVVEEAAGNGNDVVRSAVSYVLKAGAAVEQICATSSAGTAAIYFVGNELKQTIIGNAGDNILNDGGGAAADTLQGLAGNDDYVVQNSGSVILELAGAGTDTIWASVDYLLKAGVSVERMRTISDAGTTAINLTGNELQQVITGNAGANVLNDGGGAADLLIGLGGDDTYWINNSGAVVEEAAGNGNDVVRSAVDYVLKPGVAVEMLRTNDDAGTTAIDLTGNMLAQTITGNAGANILNDGGGDADRLIGLGGDDTYWINNGGAVVEEAAGNGTTTSAARSTTC